MSLSGRVVFIAGGCGTVGSGIAISLLNEGAKVAVSSRSQQRLDDFKRSLSTDLHENLVLVKEDVATEDGAKNILQVLQTQQGGVHHVISSLGGYWQGGTLTSQTVADFDNHIQERARSHFICCKTFLPVLATQKGTTYTFVTGAGAETGMCKMSPDLSMLVVGCACLYGISEAAQVEFKNSEVAVNELRIGAFVQPKLDKDIDRSEEGPLGSQFSLMGYDKVGDFMVDIIKARVKGQIRFMSKDELDAKQKEYQAIWKK